MDKQGETVRKHSVPRSGEREGGASRRLPRSVAAVVVAVLAALLLASVAWAAGGTGGAVPGGTPESVARARAVGKEPYKRKRITLAQRKASAKRAAEQRAAAKDDPLKRLTEGVRSFLSGARVMDPQGVPDYYTTPNWAYTSTPTLDASGAVIPGTGVRKFVDSLPGLGAGAANNLGQYLPVASADASTYPGSDYYVIALVEYTEKMHSDIPPTKLRGYMQLATDGVTTLSPPHYLGPAIVATKDKPVRIRFINKLPTGAGGDLFLPTDTTVMGAGMGPLDMVGMPGMREDYKQNRGTLHLHGGNSPWISDGTAHQWTTPAGENTQYPKGVSTQNVPDMPPAGPGEMTFFYTNQQSARLLFYHDHSYGITRLNVYAGEAAAYIITDPAEQELVNGNAATPIPNRAIPATIAPATIPTEQIPIVIQDKSFVTTAGLDRWDPTWDIAKWGGDGALWLPHVYMPNQNFADPTGIGALGRWDYGPWMGGMTMPFVNGPVANPLFGQPGQPAENPGTPNPSIVPETFLDTPVVNGTAYPFLPVERKAYRFRILNAANDRFWNLQLYKAVSNTPDATDPGTGLPTLQTDSGEVPMVPAVLTTGFPDGWPTDFRAGGVPDPAARGPEMIQIGNEAGFIVTPAPLPNVPVDYHTDRKDARLNNVKNHTLFLGPAERADVIIDFSQLPAGTKLILYNDSPAPVPNFDPRFDYYTDDGDNTDVGGAPNTLKGYGPNTRTIMQFQVGTGPAASVFDTNALAAALPEAFKASQKPPLVPESRYGPTYGTTYTDSYVRTTDTTATFTPFATTTPVSLRMKPKLVFESMDMEWGRMNALLGTTRPMTNVMVEPMIPFAFADPPNEEILNSDLATPIGSLSDGTQIWQIVHGGVDTHAIHFHLFDVQIINRVGIDNMIEPPHANELGWKDTVKMHPMQDMVVALRPTAQQLPWKLGDNIRLMNPIEPTGSAMGFSGWDSGGNPAVITNQPFNFGWEYTWHCHLLGHEENDMMRPVVFRVSPAAPSALAAAAGSVNLSWTNNATRPASTMNLIQRATNAAFTSGVTTVAVGANATTYSDTSVTTGTTYFYRVRAENASAYSQWTNTVQITPAAPTAPAIPPSFRLIGRTRTSLSFRWGNVANETGYHIQRRVAGAPVFATAANLGANVTSWTNTGLVPNRTYEYRIRSRNGSLYSAYSPIVRAATLR